MNPLKLSRDRKVTPKAKQTSTHWVPEIPNAFGLPAHLSCPGKTEVCQDICYAFKLERAYTNVDKLLKSNWETLQAAGSNVTKISELLESMVGDYIKEHERVERLRKAEYEKVFRIHWDGDFYSVAYAKAWANVIVAHPEIQFWAYTRSFAPGVNVVPYLVGIPNLALYLSVDSANRSRANVIKKKYPEVNIALLDSTFDAALEQIVIMTDKKAPKCPEQTGKIALVRDNGEGACVSCTLCVHGKNNVLFSISKK